MANTITNADILNAPNAYPVGLKTSVVAGAGANANIALTGVSVTDKIISVLRLNRDAAAANVSYDDLTAEASITSAGNIQLSTTVTTGDALTVVWYDKA